MNRTIKIILIIAMVLAGALFNVYIQPQLEGTPVGWFPFAQTIIVPIIFMGSSLFGKSAKRSPMWRLTFATVFYMLYTLLANFFKFEVIAGNLVATLCGALIVYLVLRIKQPAKA